MMCPRCRDTGVTVLATSPVPGVFVVFRCSRCGYVWRSTEPETATDPDRYPARFRLTTADIAAAVDVPSVGQPK